MRPLPFPGAGRKNSVEKREYEEEKEEGIKEGKRCSISLFLPLALN
jgi:hypothetical protein